MEAVLEKRQSVSRDQADALTSEPSIKECTILAARRYLEKRGFAVKQKWESDTQLGFVVEDEDVLAFVHVVSNGLDKKGFPAETIMSREEFEEAAISWLTTYGQEYVNVPVRFDELTLKVLCEDRALVRHHINALGACE